MGEYDDILGSESDSPPIKSQIKDDYSDILGSTSTPQLDDYSDILGKTENPAIKNPSTFDWKETAKDVMGYSLKNMTLYPAIKALGYVTAREEESVAAPLLKIAKGENPLPDLLPTLAAGSVGAGTKKPTESEFQEGQYTQFGDIFRQLGWSEPAAATAGLVSSMLLPSNFLLEGLGAANIPVKRLFDAGEDIAKNTVARQMMIDNAMTVGASQELFKSKLLKIFGESEVTNLHANQLQTNELVPATKFRGKVYEGKPGTIHAQVPVPASWNEVAKEGTQGFIRKSDRRFLTREEAVISQQQLISQEPTSIKNAYQSFKDQVLKAPDNTSARSIATEYNDWLEQSQLVKAKTTTSPLKSAGDKLERVYIDSLPVIKASDVLDGYKGYKGYTATMGKELARGETAGIYSGHIHKAALGDALEAKGIKTLALDPDTEFRLAINSLQEQGADEAVEQLLKSKGIREVPKLLPEERKVLDTVIAHFNTRVERLKEVYKGVTGYDMGQVPNYAFALKYENEMTPTITDLISQTMRKPKFSPSAFLKERVSNLNVPRSDFWNLVNETITNQEWFIHTMPEVIKGKQKLASPEFAKALGSNAEKAATYWKDVLLAVTNKGQLANSTPYSEFLRSARGNITKATLGFKLSSMLGQFGTIFDALAFALPEWGVGATREIAAELTKVFAIPGYRKAMIKGSKALTVRQGGELALDELIHEGGAKAMATLAMKPLQAADLSVATGIESAIKKILKKRGMDASKIDDEADMFMNLINGSSEVSYRPLLLSRGEGVKTMMTFQTFFMYHWSTMVHDLINRGLIRGDMQKKLLAGVGLGLLGAGDVAQDQARKYLYEKVTGSEIKRKETPFLQDMMWSYFVNVPFFGTLADALMRGRSPEPPLIRQFENAVVGTRQLFSGKTTETKIKGGMKVAEAGLTTFAPLPGTGQLFDFAQRLVPKAPKKAEASKAQKLRKQILQGG